MSYAGITGATDVQANVHPNFHAVSVEQVTDYVKTTSCQTNTNTGNAIPFVNAGTNYTIPRGTPFVLEGSTSKPLLLLIKLNSFCLRILKTSSGDAFVARS